MQKQSVEVIRRHSVTVRVTHWINVLCLTLLLMSGLQIFNAHPALYWGEASRFDAPLASVSASRDGETVRGSTRLAALSFDTTGLLGAYVGPAGELEARAFPSWATIPSVQDLATGRRWHFLFAWLFVINGLAYLAYSLLSGHLRRDLVPGPGELRHIGRAIVDHARLKFAHGEHARAYNVLQKLTYLAIVAILVVIVLTGLTMSPGINAALPWLTDVFGGRQSARTIHFLCAALTVLFVIVHVAMVILSGVFNNMRSMITGRYAVTVSGGQDG